MARPAGTGHGHALAGRADRDPPAAWDGRDGSGRPRSRFGRPPGRKKEPVCDDKDIPRLRRCAHDRGEALPRRRTGNSAQIQRQVTVAIKRARRVALPPFISGYGR